MRRIVINRIGSVDELEFIESDLPSVGPYDIRVKMAYAGVNPVDSKTRKGMLGLDLIFPAVLGWDIAGTVDRVGFRVSRFRAGDRVMGMIAQPNRMLGTYAEFVSAPEELFAPVPVGLSLQVAAAAPLIVLTSAQLLSKLDLPVRSRVLVTGAAGAVGRVTVQWLIQNEHEVSGLARATDKVDLASLGVHAVYASSTDAPEHAFDAVIDTAGLAETISNVRDGGQFISIADNKQPKPQRGISPQKSYVQEDGVQLASIAEHLAEGALSVPVGRIYPLSDAAAAHAALERGGFRGKILLAATAHSGPPPESISGRSDGNVDVPVR